MFSSRWRALLIVVGLSQVPIPLVAECECSVSGTIIAPHTLLLSSTIAGECGHAGVTFFVDDASMFQHTCWGQASCIVERWPSSACLETGAHQVRAECTCGRSEGSSCLPDTGQASSTFYVDTTPRLSNVSYAGPDDVGAGALVVDYEFPNTDAQSQRDLSVFVDGNLWGSMTSPTISGHHEFAIYTTCWSEGEHVFEVRAQACDKPGSSFNTVEDTSVTVNTKPEVDLIIEGPNEVGDVMLHVDYSFENTVTQPSRDLIVFQNGIYQFAFSPAAGPPVSGRYSRFVETACWPQGEHRYEVKARACDIESSLYVTWDDEKLTVDHQPTVSLDLSPADLNQPTGAQVATVQYSFPQTKRWQQRRVLVEWPDGSTVASFHPIESSGTWQETLSCHAAGPSLRAALSACGNTGAYDAVSMPGCEPDCERCPDCVGDPVRITSGNVRMPDGELLPGAQDLAPLRTYDSRNGAAGRFGLGWTSIFDSTFKRTTYGAYRIRTPSNDRPLFVLATEGYRQIWPTSGASRDQLSWEASTQTYRYRAAGSTSELVYRASDGRLVAIDDLGTQQRISIQYDAGGFPVRVADEYGNWAWMITPGPGGLIGSIEVEGRPDLRWFYQYSGARLTTITAPASAPWRSYTYDAAQRLQAARGPMAELLESHQYDGGGYATTSSGPRGEITGISYIASGRVPGELVTRVLYASGAVNDHYSRSIAGKYRLVEVAGSCPACGVFEAVYGHDEAGHVVREQDGRGYVTASDYQEAGNRLVRTHGPYRPAGCDPETASDRCRLAPDTILSVSLEPTPETTSTEYVYGDLNWPDRVTETRRPSVLEPDEALSQRTVYDASTGNVLSREARGWTGDGEVVPRREEARVTQHAYYDGVETAAFDPGGVFDPSWLQLPQPRGHLRATDGPRGDLGDVTTHVYYPVDPSVPAAWRGRRAASRNALGHVQRWDGYDVFGNAERVVDANGVATSFTYDALGRVLSTTLEGVPGCDGTTDPLCATDLTTTRTYRLASGPLETLVDPGGDASSWTYDSRGRIASHSRGPAVSDLRERIEYDYDPETGGRSQQRVLGTDGSGWTEHSRESYEYDLDGRLQRLVHSDGAYVEYGYDAAGELASVQDENHSTPNTVHRYDATGRLVETRQTLASAPSGDIATAYAYDAHGNLAEVVDANGNRTTYLTDDFGQLVAETSPVTGTTVNDYDPAGNRIYRRDARGVEAFHGYDALGRILRTSFGSPTAEPALLWEYDDGDVEFGVGRLTRTVHEAGETHYAYDRRGLIVAEADAAGSPPRVRYGYDENGNRSRVGYPSGMEVAYTFDFAGRPLSAVQAGGGPAFVTGAAYRPFGPLSRLEYGNGTVREVGHDTRYRLTGNRLLAGGMPLAQLAYQYDPAGNVISIDDELDPGYDRAFGYDDLGRLVRADTGSALWGLGSYTYDPIGNVQQIQLGASVLRSFTYLGTTPKLASVTDGGVAYSVGYDAVGNTIQQQGAAYAYSERGLFRGPVADPGEPVETLLYDARGVRVVWGYETGAGTSEGRRYRYDPAFRLIGWSSWRQPEDPGAVTEEYEVMWFAGAPVGSVRRAGPSGGPIEVTVRWTFVDHLGTPLLQSDATGEVSWEAVHEPYGQVFAIRVGLSAAQPLRLPGQEQVDLATAPAAGYYNIYRWYEPKAARYLASDPAGVGGAGTVPPVHLFAYARNSPLLLTDPLGLFSVQGCTGEQIAALTQATGALLGRITDPSNPCGFCQGAIDQIARTFVNTNFRCVTAENCLSLNGHCGQLKPGQIIELTTCAFSNATNMPFGCGCLEGTLLHEIGHSGFGTDDFTEDNNAYDFASRCLSCATSRADFYRPRFMEPKK